MTHDVARRVQRRGQAESTLGMAENEHDGDTPPLTLRLADIGVDDPGGVFAEDCLTRQPAVNLLCGVLATTESPAVIALNGEFGSGKSTFLKMCAAVLRQQNGTVVEIDAWQQRYTGDALIDLVGALSDAIPKEQERLRKAIEFAGRIARGAAWSAASKLTAGVLGQDVSSDTENSPIADWHAFKDARNKLRDAISEVAKAHGGRIVFVVDELDRCPPAYALDVLDRVRNVLDVPGVVVLYGITRTQLINAVRQEQGTGCDASSYLARFFDREVQLRAPNSADSLEFVNRQAARLPHLAEFLNSQWGQRWQPLPYHAAALMGGRLRDIQQFLCTADTVLWLARRRDHRAALTLLILRHVDRDAYHQFISGDINGYAAAVALNVQSPNLVSDSGDLTPWLQARLILCSLGARAAIPEHPAFMEAFITEDTGAAEYADEVHTALMKLHSEADNISTVTESLPYLVSLIEMSERPV